MIPRLLHVVLAILWAILIATVWRLGAIAFERDQHVAFVLLGLSFGALGAAFFHAIDEVCRSASSEGRDIKKELY